MQTLLLLLRMLKKSINQIFLVNKIRHTTQEHLGLRRRKQTKLFNRLRHPKHSIERIIGQKLQIPPYVLSFPHQVFLLKTDSFLPQHNPQIQKKHQMKTQFQVHTKHLENQHR